MDCQLRLSPQQTIEPSVFNPQLCSFPAVICRNIPDDGTGLGGGSGARVGWLVGVGRYVGISVPVAVCWTGGSAEITVVGSGVTEGVAKAAATAAVMVAPRSGLAE